MHIKHFLERQDPDPQLPLVRQRQILRRVGRIEIMALRVLAGAGVISPDDEVTAAVVFADDRVPKSLFRPGHAHRQRQQGQHRRILRVAPQHFLIAAHPGVVVDVARFRLSCDGMQKDMRVCVPGGAVSQFDMGPVHGVASLECDYPPPAGAHKFLAHLARRRPQRGEIVVLRHLDAAHPPADIDRPRAVADRVHSRMRIVIAAVDLERLDDEVGSPDIGYLHDRERRALGIPQRESSSWRESGGGGFAQIERYRDRPERSAGKAHIAYDTVVIGSAHESFQRREPAVEEQLEIA
ncbi:MAG TPA: hypothetical protein VMJ14_08935 [Burkholderiales bacterium]|nr:hypothetical protein [Burkholderiales bacterium]